MTRSLEQKSLVKTIQDTSFIKHNDWSYEEEYRIINTKGEIQCYPGIITGIYFGMNMSPLDKRAVGMTLTNEEAKQCHIYQMYRGRGKYSLRARKFDIKLDMQGIKLAF